MTQLDRLEKKLDQLLNLLGEQPAPAPIEFPAVSSFRQRCQEALAREAANKERRQLRQ